MVRYKVLPGKLVRKQRSGPRKESIASEGLQAPPVQSREHQGHLPPLQDVELSLAGLDFKSCSTGLL